MSYTKPEVRGSNWTETEYMDRLVELRTEVIPDLYKNRSDTDEWGTRNAAVLHEMDELDLELRAVRMRDGYHPETRQMPGGANIETRDSTPQTMGQRALSDEGFRGWLKDHSGTSPKVSMEYRAPGDPIDLTVAGPLLPVGQPFLAPPYRQTLTIRDLLTVIPTTLGVIPYGISVGSSSTNASTVASGATKPLTVVSFTPANAVVETIAVGIRIATRVVEDGAAVMAYIDQQLPYEIRLTEENQLLNGNGSTPNLKGFYDYAGEGLQTQAYTSTDVGRTIGLAFGKIEDKGGDVDGIVMRGSDAWSMWTKRAAGGSGTYDAGTPFASAPTTIWGYPVVRSLSMVAGKCLVGSFRRAATLWDRRSLDVQLFNQHSDWALSNEVLLLAELREALTVQRPDFVVDTAIA